LKINKIDHILPQIRDVLDSSDKHILRFGTGELSDSLALDRRLSLNHYLLEFFGNEKRAIFELKSKWADISHLLPFLNPYTVVSFSIAPQNIINSEEKRTSSLYKRLKAACDAQKAGSFVGLHFDPIIIYEGFEKDYEYLISDLTKILDLKRVIWVSLGLLRFPPKLMERFLEEGRKKLLYGEFIRGEDGKYRYLKKERVNVYKMLYNQLKSIEEGLFIYLCMEREDVWEAVTGMRLNSDEALVSLFDKRIKTCFGGSI